LTRVVTDPSGLFPVPMSRSRTSLKARPNQ
jgi:hypothetical protein